MTNDNTTDNTTISFNETSKKDIEAQNALTKLSQNGVILDPNNDEHLSLMRIADGLTLK